MLGFLPKRFTQKKTGSDKLTREEERVPKESKTINSSQEYLPAKLTQKKTDSDELTREEERAPTESKTINSSQEYLPAKSAAIGISSKKASVADDLLVDASSVLFTPPHELVKQDEGMWRVGSPPGVHQHYRNQEEDVSVMRGPTFFKPEVSQPIPIRSSAPGFNTGMCSSSLPTSVGNNKNAWRSTSYQLHNTLSEEDSDDFYVGSPQEDVRSKSRKKPF